jgi:acetoin utilization deacetylase AcuC-like enzyme
MMTGLVYNPIYLEHDTGMHPERAARLVAVMEALEEQGLRDQLLMLDPTPASVEAIAAVHTK